MRGNKNKRMTELQIIHLVFKPVQETLKQAMSNNLFKQEHVRAITR
jgi:hypothetical protein